MTRKLSSRMVDALLAAPGFDHGDGEYVPAWITFGTLNALESRGLVETTLPDRALGTRTTAFLWRRSRAGEDVALALSLDRERGAA